MPASEIESQAIAGNQGTRENDDDTESNGALTDQQTSVASVAANEVELVTQLLEL